VLTAAPLKRTRESKVARALIINSAKLRGRMRICLIYGCLFRTPSGAERFYCSLG
jgi:hypothetical protein